MNKINTFQSLRFFAFLMIFLSHIQVYRFPWFYSNAAWGVSFFIILSGFLLGCRSNKYINQFNINSIISYSIRRVKSFYSLHVFMLLITIPASTIIFRRISANDTQAIQVLVENLIKNILLIQSYFTSDYFAYNGVSWFLSLMVFLIVISIPLISFTYKIGSSDNGTYKLVFIMFIVVFIDYLYVKYIASHPLKSTNMAFWLYIFPLSRVPEYFCGMISGFIISNTFNEKNKIPTTALTLLEIISLFFLFLVMIYFSKNEWMWGFSWIFPNIFILSIFYIGKGFISKLINNKALVWLGSITLEMFLIHQVVYKYFLLACGKGLSDFANFLAVIYILTITILLSKFANAHLIK